jgi:hypothetical protein
MVGHWEGGSPFEKDVPGRPDADLPPGARTVAAIWSAIFATLIAVPAFVQSFSWASGPEDPGPSGWPTAQWIAAFFIGCGSMSLARRTRDRERLRGSKPGQRLARIAMGGHPRVLHLDSAIPGDREPRSVASARDGLGIPPAAVG